jgi:hypothetical protein
MTGMWMAKSRIIILLAGVLVFLADTFVFANDITVQGVGDNIAPMIGNVQTSLSGTITLISFVD